MRLSEHAGPRRAAHALSLLLLPASLLAVYVHALAAIWARWFPAWQQKDQGLYHRIVGGESYYTHGPLVVLVSLATALLVIRYRRISVKPRPLAGGILLVVGLLAHLGACMARISFASAFSIVVVLVALILMLWGADALRKGWFAVAILLFAAPLPEVTIAELNFRLKIIAAEWGVRLANTLGIIAVRSGNKVFMEAGKELIVTNVCSGLRTLISLMAFGAIYAYVSRLRGWRKWVLFATAPPVALVGNAIRILTLIAVADVFGVQAAAGWFHGLSGILILAVAFTLMLGLERLILLAQRLAGRPDAEGPLQAARAGPQDGDQWRRLASELRRPAGAAATIILMVSAAGAWHLNKGAWLAPSAQMLKAILPEQLEIDEREFRSYELSLGERDLLALETPEYVYRRYQSTRGARAALDFCLIYSRDNRKGIHPPDLCLEGDGQSIVSKADVTARGAGGKRSIPCRELVVQGRGRMRYFLYTYKCGGNYTRSFWRQQLVIFSNGLLRRNSAGALVRISTPTTPRQISEARELSLALLRESVPYIDRALP